jgi:predicted component of type VI protein secretion system
VEYEPRIDVLSVQVDDSPGEPNLLLIRIDYRVRSNNAAGNLVYPFFLQEGG